MWLALYPLAWALLFLGSASYWFLPAGLRLAVLWSLPRRAWKWMALLEWAGILATCLWRGGYPPLLLATVTVVPWLVYAATVAWLGKRAGGVATLGGSLPRLLVCGALAGAVNATLLSVVAMLATGPQAYWIPKLFDYVAGELIGVVVVAPALLAAFEHLRRRAPPWRELFAHGLVLVPVAALLAVARLPVPQPVAYATAAGLLPLFWLSFRYGWRAAALALALLSVVAHALEGMLHVWSPQQLQLLVAVCGIAALMLGASTEGLRAQGKALMLSLEQLRRHSTDLADVATRLTSVQERERRRLGGELHDVLGQDITAIATRLRVVERSADDPALRAGLNSILQLVNQSHHHLREVIENLYPAVLDRYGLQRALGEGPLAQLARDSGLDYRSEVLGDLGPLSNEAATSLYRICQEATSNCARHPQCKSLRIHVEVQASPTRSQLVLRIHDDAGPIQLDPDNPGMGLQHIRDRANALGALYRFDAHHGYPRHWLSLPLPRPEGPPSMS